MKVEKTARSIWEPNRFYTKQRRTYILRARNESCLYMVRNIRYLFPFIIRRNCKRFGIRYVAIANDRITVRLPYIVILKIPVRKRICLHPFFFRLAAAQHTTHYDKTYH